MGVLIKKKLLYKANYEENTEYNNKFLFKNELLINATACCVTLPLERFKIIGEMEVE